MILYKYYPCNEYTFRALSEMGVWCSPASNMNDPFDCLGDLKTRLDESNGDVVIEQYRKILEEVRPDYKHFRWEYLEDMISRQRKEIIDQSIFCSLTENKFNNLMWAHYANSHRGIVLGLEFPDKAIKKEELLQKIEYVPKPPIFDPIHHLNLLKAHIARQSIDDTSQLGSEELEAAKNLIKSISVKTEDWSYENEWRLWALLNQKPQYTTYKVEQLKSVYFGLRCAEETKTLVKSILRGHGVSDDVYHDIKVKTDPKIELYI